MEDNSVQFNCSVMSDSLQAHGLQHPRPPYHHQLPEFTQTHVQWVSDTIQPSHPLSSPSPPAFTVSSIRVFSSESVLCLRWPKYWSFSYCDGFCHTLTWIGHRHICGPSILNLPPPPPHPIPLGCHRDPALGCPVSYIKFKLAIYFIYGNIYVTTLFSQIIPLSFSHWVQKSALYSSVSFAALHVGSSVPSF